MTEAVNDNKRMSKVWLVPILALVIGCWMIYQHISSQGPLVTLIINNAEGLEAGKTKVKSLSVDIGVIESIQLSEDFTKAILKARINNNAADMIVEDAQFWVVKPRIGTGGVSGLSTLLSGSYLEVKPGVSKKEHRHFEVLENTPLIGPEVPGIKLELFSKANKALSVGSSINFRGFKVGQIETVNYNVDTRTIKYGIFVHAPYNSLITQNTRFWVKPGFEVSLDAKGIKMEMESIESLISGGITFGVPEGWKAGDIITEPRKFELYVDKSAVLTESYESFLEYVLFFDESVAGLVEGAAVEYKGIQVGRVRAIPYMDFSKDHSYEFHGMIPVLVRIEFDRWRLPNDGRGFDYWLQVFNKLRDEGLRARIKTGNLLTGAKLIDISVVENALPDPEQEALAKQYDLQTILTVKGGFDQLEQKVSLMLDKINNLQIEATINNANQLLANTDATMQSMNKLVSSNQTQQIPAELTAAIQQANVTLRSYSKDSQIHKDLTQTIRALEQTLRELQPFIRKVSAKPNAIIFDGPKKRDPRLENN